MKFQDLIMKALWASIGTLGTLVGGIATNEIKTFNDNFTELHLDMKYVKDSVHTLSVDVAEMKGEAGINRSRIQALEKQRARR